jgi:orotidine-5'-phosphate decarboxylase
VNTPRFLDKLEAAASTNRSWVCVGLDPDPALAPTAFAAAASADWIAPFLRGVVEATADLVCCYKPNVAFYEALGATGMEALRETLRIIPPHIPVLGDAKRGDVGNTARAYAQALFDELGFDAATVSPYLGADALEPFFAYPDRGVFVLAKTSNPGSGAIQNLLVDGPGGTREPLYLAVTRQALAWDQHGTLGLVVGATYPEELARVRAVAPRTPILVPGVGAQAGDLAAAVQAGADADGGRAIVNASRSVLYASRGADWQAAARQAASDLRDGINAALAERVPAGGAR